MTPGHDHQGSLFNGKQTRLRHCSVARAMRVVHGRNQQIVEHAHDFVCLTIPVLGECHESCDVGTAVLDGPSAVLHPAGSAHADKVGRHGLETVSVKLDPEWVQSALGRSTPTQTRWWHGGATGMAASRLAALWADPLVDEDRLKSATLNFLNVAIRAPAPPRPHWYVQVREALLPAGTYKTSDLACKLNIHPAWLARAYRAAAGEGVEETLRRRRVAAAAALARETDLPIAQIAAEVGFCDQSHMNRCFRLLIGRTPLQVRSEVRLQDNEPA